jgi:hypothetical protein
MENTLPEGFFIGKDGKYYQKLKLGLIETVIKHDTLPKQKESSSKKKKTYSDTYFKNYLGKKIRLKIDPLVKSVLDTILIRRKRGLDCVIIVTGYSGAGKSVLVSHTIAPYLNSDFKEAHVYFNSYQMIEDAPLLPNNSTLVLDESYKEANTRAGSSVAFLRLMNFLNTIRVKGHTIVLILPDYFQLNSQLALFRSNFLIHVYIDKKTHQRGRLLLFDRDKKKNLYIKGKKFLDYHAGSANFRARFYLNKGIFDDESYLKRKMNFLQELNNDIGKKTPKNERDDLICKLYMEKNISQVEIATMCNIDPGRVSQILKKNGLKKPKKHEKLNKRLES